MMNLELLKEREKIFDEFRKISKEMDVVIKDMNDIQTQLKDKNNLHNKLLNKQTYLNKLINIMLLENCDPVEAKLKYDEELSKVNSGGDAMYIGSNDISHTHQKQQLYKNPQPLNARYGGRIPS